MCTHISQKVYFYQAKSTPLVKKIQKYCLMFVTETIVKQYLKDVFESLTLYWRTRQSPIESSSSDEGTQTEGQRGKKKSIGKKGHYDAGARFITIL